MGVGGGGEFVRMKNCLDQASRCEVELTYLRSRHHFNSSQEVVKMDSSFSFGLGSGEYHVHLSWS